MDISDFSKKPDMVLFVGNARSAEYQGFKERGMAIGLLHDSNCPISFPSDGEFAEVITVDSDHDAAYAAFNQLQQKYNIVAQVASVETAVYDNAALATKTKLPAPSVEAAEAALSKPMMRSRFIAKLGARSTSASAIAQNEKQLLKFAAAHHYPLILKPTNLFGSMFVTKNHSAGELSKNYKWMTAEIRRHLDSTGRRDDPVEIQVETYLEGTNHSIDCLVDGRGNPTPTEIVDVLTERDFGGEKVQHYARYAPSILDRDKQNTCKEFASAAVRALGLTYCVAHVEFILTRNGPRILEIAARPGGNRVHLMKQVFGLDIMEAYYLSLTNQTIMLNPQQAKPRAIISIYPENCGNFASIRDEAAIRALPGYIKHSIRVNIGEPVGPASDGHLPTLSIELASETMDELLDAITGARTACNKIEVTAQ